MVRYNNDLDNYESYYHHEEHETYDSPEDPYSERSPRPPPPTRASRHADDNDSSSHLFHREHVMPAAGHALAGAVGSALANLATYPLDVVSTRLKVQRHAMAQRLEREELQRHHKGKTKTKTKTRGRRSSTSSSSSATGEEEAVGIFNVTQEQAKEYHVRETREGTTVVESWEYEYEDEELYRGHFDAVQKIYEKEGIQGFYHGVGWDTVGTAASGFWYFMAYTLLRKQRLHILAQHGKHTQSLPVMEELGIGIAASALSKLVSTPFSNIVTRKQTAAMLYPGAKTPSFDDIYHDIMREKGITGFWSGYTASLLLTFNPSITFLLYEYAKPHMTAHKGGSLDKMDIFLLAALCKAAATTLTYPLNVIKIRSQMDDGGDEYDGILDSSASGVKGIHVSRGRAAKNKIDTHYRRAVRRASGIVELLSEIVKREGITALYIGLGGTIAKGFISHGVTMMIKENVHRFIIKLYFFVLDAYQRSEYGSFREAALGKTLEGVRKTGHVVGSATRKIESAKEKVSHIGERVKEKAHLGHHSHTQSHSSNHRESTSRDRLIESRPVREEGRSFRGREDEQEEMFEERFAATPRGRSERTIIREEHITEELPRGRREAAHREERLAVERAERLEREVSRGRQTTREEHIRTTTTAARPQPAQRVIAVTGANVSAGNLVGAPPVPLAKQTERVSQWRDRVAEETAMAAAAAAIVKPEMVTTRHETLEGAHGEHIDRTITTQDITFSNDVSAPGHGHHRHRNHHREIINSRDPSMASGQTYRSAGGRTSLLVHPPSSYRERVTGEWTEDARFANTSSHGRLTGGRPLMGGGDIGVNGEVRRTIETKDIKVWK